MKKKYQQFIQYFMAHYKNQSVLTKQKVKLLFYYLIFCKIIIIIHFVIMFWYIKDVDRSQLWPSPFLLLLMIYLNYLLIKGKFDFAANLSLIGYTILLTIPAVRHIYYYPSEVYSMDFYFFSIILVQGALFNRIPWIISTALFFIILDIFCYFQISQRVTGLELHICTRGAVSSGITILLIGFFSIILKVITHNAIQRSEEASELNLKNFNRIKSLLDSVTNTSSILSKHSEKLTHSANEFIDESQSQAATIEEVSSASEEVFSNIEQVGHVLDSQHENIKILLHKMDELSSMISEINVQISNVNISSVNITSMAEKGGKVLQQMSMGMNKVAVSSKEMMNIVAIISDIADRINLLSLNASIEAARAGNAGRGFAVVADEISRLGDITQSNMREINKLIRSSTDEIDEGLKNTDITVSAMTEIIDKISIIVTEITDVSTKTTIQQNINKSVNNEAESLREKSEHIKQMMDEQQVALNEIVKAIVSINDITQAYVEGSQKLFADAEKVDQLASELKHEVELQN